jgi:hypothetical protein
MMLQPSIMNGATMADVGKRVGCTKASLSKVGIEFGKHFKIHFRRQRKAGAAANMAASRNRFYSQHESPKKGHTEKKTQPISKEAT